MSASTTRRSAIDLLRRHWRPRHPRRRLSRPEIAFREEGDIILLLDGCRPWGTIHRASSGTPPRILLKRIFKNDRWHCSRRNTSHRPKCRKRLIDCSSHSPSSIQSAPTFRTRPRRHLRVLLRRKRVGHNSNLEENGLRGSSLRRTWRRAIVSVSPHLARSQYCETMQCGGTGDRQRHPRRCFSHPIQGERVIDSSIRRCATSGYSLPKSARNGIVGGKSYSLS